MRVEVEELFHELAELTVQARARYFAEHQVDTTTRREVEALLKFDAPASMLLDGEIGHVAHEALKLLELPDTRCGPYRLTTLLGRGGMGTVHLAERVDGEIAQRVAVKLLRPGMDDPHLRQRFLAERQILATLSHPNIARLLDAGHRDDGQPYLVMEYVEGTTIDVYANGLGLRQKVHLFLKVCAAVSYLHRHLVVHRDLKPSNILVTPEGEPKLLDFGIAKLLDLSADAATTGLQILTPDYASPEQVAGGPVTTATDVYSLGAVFYKLLTGESPHKFTGESPGEIVAAIASGSITPPAKLAPSVKGDLETILLKALRREPQARYATVDQLAEDLERYLESRPIRARKGDAWYRARKFLRRYWLPTTALLVALAGLTGGLLTAHRQRDLAQRRFDEVRQLASQLFTIEKDIQQVAGATGARERIVKIALEYLERLSREAGNDLLLKTEIASAYAKAASIQGGSRATNLGHPMEARASLQKAEAFFRDVANAKPRDAAALHNLLDTVELRSRIEYGQMSAAGVEETLGELRTLIARYEPLAPANRDEWDFLGGVYQTMSVSARRLTQPALALEFAARSVHFQQQAARESSDPRMLGHLSGSLSAYGKVQRAQGDLNGALRTMRESLEIAERLARQDTANQVVLINLAAGYSDVATIHAEENGISFGNREEATKWYERSLAVGRKVVQADPKENQSRANTAAVGFQFANVVRHGEPSRAVALYDEAIQLLRGMPAKAPGRDVRLGMLLAESTFPLRALRREAEARERLAEAKQLAEATKSVSPHSPLMPIEAIVRAEADWALALGRPGDAAALHQAWLQRLQFGAESVQKDLHSAILFAAHYRLLSEAYRKAGEIALAEQAKGKRREILEFWRERIRDRFLIEGILGQE